MYSLNNLLREAEDGLVDAVNPFAELRGACEKYTEAISLFLLIQYAIILILLFAVFLNCGGSEFYRVLLSAVFVDLYRVGDQRNPEIPPKPELEIQIVTEDPEGLAVRERINKRIQAEIHPEDKEEEVMAEEMVEVSPEWNEAPDLMMEDENVLLEAEGCTKQKRDEVALRRRKQRKEDDIRPEKHLHLSTASWSTQNPEGLVRRFE